MSKMRCPSADSLSQWQSELVEGRVSAAVVAACDHYKEQGAKLMGWCPSLSLKSSQMCLWAQKCWGPLH